MQRIRNQVQQGQIRLPENNQFVVEIELVDGTLFPYKGKITFADPSYNSQTGTFLIRASVDNPKGVLRPNQYVRTRMPANSAWRYPRRAATSSKPDTWRAPRPGRHRPLGAGQRPESWSTAQGLAAGDRVVVDGALRLAPDAPVKATAYTPKPDSPEAAAPTRPPGATLIVNFASGKAALDTEATRLLKGFAPSMKADEFDLRYRLRRPHRQSGGERRSREASRDRRARRARRRGHSGRSRAPQAAAGRDRTR